MHFIPSFLWIRARSIKHQIKTNLRRRWLEFSIPILIISGLAIGGHALFLRGAKFLLEQGEIGQLLLDKVFYLGWSIIFYLLILSNIITAFSTIYRSPEVSFLLTKPLSYLNIFQAKLIENLVYSSWAILILGLPLTIAYGNVKALSFLDMLIIFPLGIAPFLLMATCTGLCILMVVVRLSKWFRVRSIFLTLGTIFTVLIWMYFKYSQQETMLVGNAASFRAVSRYMFNLTQTPFPLIPSFWLSEILSAYSAENWSEFIFYGALMITTGLVGLEVTCLLAKQNYFITIQMVEGTKNRRQRQTVRKPITFKQLKWLTPQLRGLVIKDVLQFVRTPQQWVQFLLFGFFIGIYLINLSLSDVRLAHLSPFWRTLVYIFNFGFSGFVIAALSSRFVFPLISLEGNGLWILLASPLKLTKLFKEKFVISFVIFFSLAEIVALVSNYFLSQEFYISVLSTVFLFMMSLSLVSLSLGLGAVFPQFHERNPMRITSGAGGIITVILSLFYVAIMVGALVWIITFVERGFLNVWLVIIFTGIVILNAMCIYVPLKWGHRSLLNTEL